MFKPKVGSTVSVCYDGKAGRAVDGVVLKTKRNKILVRFDEWAGDGKEITHWFRRTSNRGFGSYVPVDKSLMNAMFGAPGDWYSVFKWFGESLR